MVNMIRIRVSSDTNSNVNKPDINFQFYKKAGPGCLPSQR